LRVELGDDLSAAGEVRREGDVLEEVGGLEAAVAPEVVVGAGDGALTARHREDQVGDPT
jgi:hypothetical protein